MSAQVWALGGIVLGALLAGGASLLLAWRQETLEARAGVEVVQDLLKRAERRVNTTLSIKTGGNVRAEWWRPGDAPTTEPWRAYQRALIARLPRRELRTVSVHAQDDAARRAADDCGELAGCVSAA